MYLNLNSYLQVLTQNDEFHLHTLSHEMAKTVTEALGELDFSRAAGMVKSLQNLVVIDHPTVQRVLLEAKNNVHQYFRSAGDKVKEDCHFTR